MSTPFTPPAPLTGEPSALQGPTPADLPPAANGGQETGGTPHSAPWQRVDAAWPVIPNSPTGLDGDAQKLVRHLLTRAAGQRLSNRRQLEAERLWMWKPMPHLADYTRQRRFYAPALYRFPPLDLCRMLRDEARLALEVIATPPGALGGAEVWQELVELQCQRIAQLTAALQGWLGSTQAQQALQHLLEGLT